MPYGDQDQEFKAKAIDAIQADLAQRWEKAKYKALCIVKLSPRRHVVCRISPVTTYFLGSVIFGPATHKECLDYLHANT